MIILDTNVISELMRAQPDPQVMDWIGTQEAEQLFVTTITQAEIHYGLNLLPGGKRRNDLEQAIGAVFEQDFRQRVLVFDSQAAKEYGTLAALRRKQGRPIAQADALIAAIVRVHQAVLATRNIADFCDCDLPLINPWQLE